MEAFGLTKKQMDVVPKQKEDIQLKINAEGKLECGVCHRTFPSRNEFDDHWLACHQDTDLSLASGSMGSMQSSGQQQCNEETPS